MKHATGPKIIFTVSGGKFTSSSISPILKVLREQTLGGFTIQVLPVARAAAGTGDLCRIDVIAILAISLEVKMEHWN